MNKNRLEAFSDGVIAILITIMVLELRIPEGADWPALQPIVPVFITYVLSFVFLGIYWNNHHHLIHMADRITGGILWANLHLLFWLSLTPFATGWMGRNNFAPLPTAVYGGVDRGDPEGYDPKAARAGGPRARALPRTAPSRTAAAGARG